MSTPISPTSSSIVCLIRKRARKMLTRRTSTANTPRNSMIVPDTIVRLFLDAARSRSESAGSSLSLRSAATALLTSESSALC
ncbi:MAG: hypothetical protein IJ055_08870 [Oscillospiraceae bacterium]|nr:hypothetical protein [Oscillospiraceae bacterium]